MATSSPSPFEAYGAGSSSAEGSPPTTTRRIVGFDASRTSSQDIGLNLQASCDLLQDRPQRQSSLGQQLLLHKFESQRPKLSLNTKKSKAKALQRSLNVQLKPSGSAEDTLVVNSTNQVSDSMNTQSSTTTQSSMW